MSMQMIHMVLLTWLYVHNCMDDIQASEFHMLSYLTFVTLDDGSPDSLLDFWYRPLISIKNTLMLIYSISFQYLLNHQNQYPSAYFEGNTAK